jgi:hypothetical protein
MQRSTSAATGIDRLVKGQWATRSSSTARLLIGALGNGVRDVSATEQPTAARVAVAFVGDEAIRPRARASPSTGPWYPDAVQHRSQLRTVVPLARRDHDRERSALAIAGQMKLGRQPSAAAAKPLIGGMLDPPFSSARLGRRRAPLAC